MTKKTLNAMKRAAFEEFRKSYTDEQWSEMFGSESIIFVYEFSEGTRTERVEVQRTSQINYNTLEELGFSRNAEVRFLFTVNRQTKTVNR